jgi:hypothetical protein
VFFALLALLPLLIRCAVSCRDPIGATSVDVNSWLMLNAYGLREKDTYGEFNDPKEHGFLWASSQSPNTVCLLHKRV